MANRIPATNIQTRAGPPVFDAQTFLSEAGEGRILTDYKKNERVFQQGDAADAVFYIQRGKVKLTVVSTQGKEAVIAILGSGDFFGEACLVNHSRRVATATTLSDCAILRL